MVLRGHPRIEMNHAVCHGQPVIAGTRIMVSQILGAMAYGQTTDELIEDYPTLAPEDIAAALAFASQLSRLEEIPLPEAHV